MSTLSRYFRVLGEKEREGEREKKGVGRERKRETDNHVNVRSSENDLKLQLKFLQLFHDFSTDYHHRGERELDKKRG